MKRIFSMANVNLPTRVVYSFAAHLFCKASSAGRYDHVANSKGVTDFALPNVPC